MMARTWRQRLGQHFLRDGRVAEKIVWALPDAPAQVLEIGPGRGALTQKLLQRFPRVQAVELDAALASQLKARLDNPSGLEVVEGDALSLDLGDVGARGPWSVAANLPYSVATAILRRLLWLGSTFPVLVVMVQREVAIRMLAPPKDKARGALSVEVQLLADGELLFPVSPGSFSPPPKVWSAVVRLRSHWKASEDLLQSAIRLARAAFTHRRKKLTNALAGVLRDVPAFLEKAGLPGELRAQDLELEQWLALARVLKGDP